MRVAHHPARAVSAITAGAWFLLLPACGGSSSTTININNGDTRIHVMIDGVPAPQPPMTLQEGVALLRQIRDDPQRANALTPRELQFLARARASASDD